MNTKNSLLFAVAVLSAAYSATAEESQSIPLQSQITHVQPMTGIVLWSDSEAAQQHPESISLEYRYCGYNEVVNARGEYDWSKIDQVLDDIVSRNHQAILRFYFVYVGKQTTVPDHIRLRDDYEETIATSENKKTHFCDWSNEALREFTLEFYAKLADRYDDDPRIAFLQTGFGLWAEYHIYSGPRQLGKHFPDKEFQSRFLRHMDAQFENLPWSISVDSADDDYSPLEGNAELLALDFGLFDDSFLCKQHATENAVNWKILGLERWKRQPCGGEFSYYSRNDQRNALTESGPNGVSFEEAAKQFHITYMIGNDQPRHSTMERIRSAGMTTGYRFRVAEARLTKASVRGNQLRLRVTNEGVAPIYRDAFFAAGNKRSTTSLRGLLPGEDRWCEIEEVESSAVKQITIQSDWILPSQTIQHVADLE